MPEGNIQERAGDYRIIRSLFDNSSLGFSPIYDPRSMYRPIDSRDRVIMAVERLNLGTRSDVQGLLIKLRPDGRAHDAAGINVSYFDPAIPNSVEMPMAYAALLPSGEIDTLIPPVSLAEEVVVGGVIRRAASAFEQGKLLDFTAYWMQQIDRMPYPKTGESPFVRR